MSEYSCIDSRLIIRLVNDYVYGLDEKNEQRFLSVWHADGVYEVPALNIKFGNLDGITAAVHSIWDAHAATNHSTTNYEITFVDDTVAHGEGRAIAISLGNDGARSLSMGKYTDEFEKREGVWKFAMRKVDIQHVVPLPASLGQ